MQTTTLTAAEKRQVSAIPALSALTALSIIVIALAFV